MHDSGRRGFEAADLWSASGDTLRRHLAGSQSNASGAPVPCEEEYVRGYSTSLSCSYLVANERYLAILTSGAGPTKVAGREVERWMASANSDFRWVRTWLASDAAAPFATATPNASAAPADAHLFFRDGVHPRIETVLDDLVAQRNDDWFFAPFFRPGYRTADRDSQHCLHEFLMPFLRVWDFGSPSLQQVRDLVGVDDLVHHSSIGSDDYQVQPATRSAFEVLALENRLSPDGWFTRAATQRYRLPGDRCPKGVGAGPSGGLPATPVPVSGQGSLLLAAALGLSAVAWLRRR